MAAEVFIVVRADSGYDDGHRAETRKTARDGEGPPPLPIRAPFPRGKTFRIHMELMADTRNRRSPYCPRNSAPSGRRTSVVTLPISRACPDSSAQQGVRGRFLDGMVTFKPSKSPGQRMSPDPSGDFS